MSTTAMTVSEWSRPEARTFEDVFVKLVANLDPPPAA
jgi:hypothetical protein